MQKEDHKSFAQTIHIYCVADHIRGGSYLPVVMFPTNKVHRSISDFATVVFRFPESIKRIRSTKFLQ